jgi:hypothetical protein
MNAHVRVTSDAGSGSGNSRLGNVALGGTPELTDPVAIYLIMKPQHYVSERKAATAIGIGAALFTIGAMIFGY